MNRGAKRGLRVDGMRHLSKVLHRTVRASLSHSSRIPALGRLREESACLYHPAMRILPFAACAFALAVACGTESEPPGDDDTAPVSEPCPAIEPSLGAPCNRSDGDAFCGYPAVCCNQEYVCSGGLWRLRDEGRCHFGPSVPESACPAAAPTAGTLCCEEPWTACAYGVAMSCDQGTAPLTLRCTNEGVSQGQFYIPAEGGIWEEVAGTCEPETCGVTDPITCQPGQICVRDMHGGFSEDYTYRCATNPCEPSPPNCACGAAVCSNPQKCEDAGGHMLNCADD
jgi:hypothetical protein